MSNTLVVLGAADPEMNAIEELCRQCGFMIAHAIGPDGERVHGGNAYKSIGYREPQYGENSALYTEFSTEYGGQVWLVECGGDLPPNGIRIDHHRPGDPGFGLPPSEFWRASSLGQVVTRLFEMGLLAETDASPENPGMYPDAQGALLVTNRRANDLGSNDFLSAAFRIGKELLLVAAADHCLEAACCGLCPGVDPDELMTFRAQQRAAFRKVPVEQILAEIETARQHLHFALTVDGYADLRGQSIPELPEAACREGIPFLSTVTEPSGRRKVVLMAVPQGSDLVTRFKAGEIVPGLTDHYGDAARGFAGGYLPAE